MTLKQAFILRLDAAKECAQLPIQLQNRWIKVKEKQLLIMRLKNWTKFRQLRKL